MIYNELRQKILLKYGVTDVNSSDCKKIAADITKSLNRQISTTTIKRVFGFAVRKYRFSKHTLITLQEYASQKHTLDSLAENATFSNHSSYISASKSYAKLKILSFIDFNGISPYKSKPQYHLHPEQLVAYALKILLDLNLDSMPIFRNDKYLGEIYTKDLLHFLGGNDNKDGLLYHKLNFDLQSAITAMHKTSTEIQ